MAQGLSVSDVVRIGIILSPTAAQGRNFGTLLVLGSSPVIDAAERIRTYTTLPGVAADFGTIAPEYLAAASFFGQSPMPSFIKIGRWAQSATNGVLRGAILSGLGQATALATLQGVTAGALSVTVDGATKALTGLNFSAAANLNGIAGVITAALGASGSCIWNGSRFSIQSASTGTASSVGYAASTGGTDVAGVTGLSQAAGARPPVAGIAAETAVQAVQVLMSLTSDWYAVTLAPVSGVSDAAMLAVAATIEAASPSRMLGITTQATAALDPTSSTDLGALLKLSGYSKTTVQYSSTNAYAIASFFGRALAVNFTGSNTVITMKFKQEPGVIPEQLSETQAATLESKGINVFVLYQNNTSIIQQGTVSSGRFFDEVQGLDWLANTVQNDLFNVLYQSQSKIPQTDDGIHVLLTQMEATLSVAVRNGMIAPGVWNAEGFGQLKRGDPLPKGFYVFTELVATQSQADREARKSPLLQAAIKLAGAVHSVDAQISVNR